MQLHCDGSPPVLFFLRHLILRTSTLAPLFPLCLSFLAYLRILAQDTSILSLAHRKRCREASLKLRANAVNANQIKSAFMVVAQWEVAPAAVGGIFHCISAHTCAKFQIMQRERRAIKMCENGQEAGKLCE